jgi:hypothetical protein
MDAADSWVICGPPTKPRRRNRGRRYRLPLCTRANLRMYDLSLSDQAVRCVTGRSF